MQKNSMVAHHFFLCKKNKILKMCSSVCVLTVFWTAHYTFQHFSSTFFPLMQTLIVAVCAPGYSFSSSVDHLSINLDTRESS